MAENTSSCQEEDRMVDELAPKISQETVSPENLQQYYYECFGDRDWDAYQHDEQIFLKRNIGFAIFGAPADVNFIQNETGYTKKQNAQIDEIYNIILKNHYLEEKSVILTRTIFICCQLKDKKKTLIVEPVFVLKKCHSRNGSCLFHNCKIYIDNQARVYQTWESYLENNRLPKCIMVFPKYGQYSGEIVAENEVKVILESRESPACGIGNVILDGADTTGTVVSVGATLTFVAAAIPGIVVAPALLTASAIGGVGVGLYSVGRSIQTLVNRRNHDQSIGLDNAESRWCWLNTTVGVLGASASAATGLLTRAASKGVEVGQSARIAFNTLNAANIVGSATNLAFSGYNIVQKLIDEERISPLEMFQFASSILFLHQSIVNFRTASVIISETQSQTLLTYEQTLRSNKHRKLFRKAQLEARRLRGDMSGNAEVISGIQNINDPDNFFAGLARINKDLNRNDARYTITTDGKVSINSNYIVDPMEFATMSRDARTNILQSLPAYQTTPVLEIPITTFDLKQGIVVRCCKELLANPFVLRVVRDMLANKFDVDTIILLIQDFCEDAIKYLLNILASFLTEIHGSLQEFKRLHPMVSLVIGALQYLIFFIRQNSAAVKLDCLTYLGTCFNHDGSINLQFLTELVQNFKEWLKNKIETLKRSFGDPMASIRNKRKERKNCQVCSGHFYETV